MGIQDYRIHKEGCGQSFSVRHNDGKEIWEFIQDTDSVSLAFLQEVIDVNMAIAEEGLRKDYGLHGKRNYTERKRKLDRIDIANTASFTTACSGRKNGRLHKRQ